MPIKRKPQPVARLQHPQKPRTIEKPAYSWSPEQQAIIAWVREGSGNAMIEAVAGSGKTSILKGAGAVMEGTKVYCAYNRKIADEIAEALNGVPGVQVATFHSLGLAAWSRYCRANHRTSPKIDARKKRDEVLEKIDVEWNLRDAVWALVSIAKQDGVDVLWDARYESEIPNEKWRQLIDHYSILDEVEEVAANTAEGILIAKIISYATRCVTYSRQIGSRLIDFDDMIWLPLVENASITTYDWVLGDEFQDVNAVRREFARRMMKPTSRALFVADRFQNIYGFCHPPGVKILTPSGLRRIEMLDVGDSVVVADTQGSIEGWSGRKRIREIHKYDHCGELLTIQAGHRSVEATPHHRIPVRIGDAKFYTYMMRRNGIFRVGYCSAYNGGDFMLQQRMRTEKADAVWILRQHKSKKAAKELERVLLQHVKGTTFQLMTDEEVSMLPSDEYWAEKILFDHGRMIDFPLLAQGRKDIRIARNGAFITEMCNVMSGMKVAFYDEAQVPSGSRSRGRGRQTFIWTPVIVSSRKYSGPVYGITVDKTRDEMRVGYLREGVPLYFAGDGQILVHNTGSGSDAVQRTIEDFQCATFPLTTTFRCSQSATALAQDFVPHIHAHDKNEKGTVIRVPETAFRTHLLDEEGDISPRAGDVILCRNTKPLVEMAMYLIRNGVGCSVEGRDIGANIMALIRKWKKVGSIEELQERLKGYGKRQSEKLIAKNQLYKLDALYDRVETAIVLTKDCATIQEVDAKVRKMFEDVDSTGARKIILLSTVHKAKGREWNRVFILGWDRYMPSKWARQEWERQSEVNLQYVAVTRCRRELILILKSE